MIYSDTRHIGINFFASDTWQRSSPGAYLNFYPYDLIDCWLFLFIIGFYVYPSLFLFEKKKKNQIKPASRPQNLQSRTKEEFQFYEWWLSVIIVQIRLCVKKANIGR